MTYCEEVGLKVGDKIRYIGDHKDKYYKGEKHSYWSPGDILTLEEDDSTPTPVFSGNRIFSECFGLKDREWEKVVEEENSTDITSSVVTKDTIANVELTWEELLTLKLLAGQTQTSHLPENLYEKLSKATDTHLVTESSPDVYAAGYDRVEIDVYSITWDKVKFSKWVDSHFMSPSKAKAFILRKQAEELIKQAEELEGND